jgi:hypothetical protein
MWRRRKKKCELESDRRCLSPLHFLSFSHSPPLCSASILSMDGGFLPVEPPTQAFPRVGGGGAGPSGRPPQPAPRCAGAASACARCPALSTTDPEWTAAFSLPLCPSCKAADHLVSRKTAKELYLVTDADLGRLGSLSRANPIGKEKINEVCLVGLPFPYPHTKLSRHVHFPT